MKLFKLLTPSLFCLAVLFSCSAKKSSSTDKKEIWIYASMYKEVIATYNPVLKEAFPNLDIKWFQGGSENIAAKLMAEYKGGKTKADILMTADLFFFMELKRLAKLKKIDMTQLSHVPQNYIDPDQQFFVDRFPVMVLAYNKSFIKDDMIPRSFSSLLDAKYKNKITMPSPLQSGTTLTTSLYMKNLFGLDYFKGLRANNILSSGGNGSTLARIQSGEKPIGIVLMENVLQAKHKGLINVEFVIPEEGAFLIPCPLAILNDTEHPKEVQKLMEWFMSKAATDLLVQGWIYSSLPNSKTPPGGPDFGSFKTQKWDIPTFEKWSTERQAIKKSFQKIILQ